MNVGSANARSFSRGKRGLAGSMIFTLFDRSALYQIMRKEDGEFDYYTHEFEQYTLDSNTNVWDWATAASAQAAGDGIQTVKRHAEFADQIMPFNITLIAQNEYGLAAWMAILGLEILNEGGGLSVDDITNEEQMTYVARSKTAWVPWTPDQDDVPSATGNLLDSAGSNTSGITTVKTIGGSFGDELTVLDAYKNWLKLDN